MASILVVDDDADIRALIETVLEPYGHEVATASGGQEAINKIKRKPYDLVILDIMMPGLSGYDVLDQIRAMPSRADTPVIVVTAKHDPEGLKREIKGGAVDHIAKPFMPEELEEIVQRALTPSDEGTSERRRMLKTEADTYGSIADLRSGMENDQT
jgi:CheY-like chemotaxis protein